MDFGDRSTVSEYKEAPFTLGDPAYAFDTEGMSTPTSREQLDVEQSIANELDQFDANETNTTNFVDSGLSERFRLRRQAHILYVLRSMRQLGRGYMSMDASRTWFAYWGTHSLRLLGHRLDDELKNRLVNFLRSCEAPGGGYGGAPGHFAHLATTYAAVMTLVSIGNDDALASIDRPKLRAFLRAMKRANGSFSLHEGGEADVRGTYCAIAVASITHLPLDDLFDGTAPWILSCQTYEGGFGGEPNCEAHGGYTYCAMTSLVLLTNAQCVDSNRVLAWLAKRQMSFEGGFNGRANKLVDGCYSFWQPAAFQAAAFAVDDETAIPSCLYGVRALQQYVLVACQERAGGLRDKPTRPPDLYHTCYCLSGLSIAQTYQKEEMAEPIVGGDANRLEKVCPLYNVCEEMLLQANNFFSGPVESRTPTS